MRERAMHFLRRGKGLAAKPLRDEEERTLREAKQPLTRDEITAVAVAALLSVFIYLTIYSMRLAKYSTLAAEDFTKYHPYTPFLWLAGAALYFFALWKKGVDYWLAYVPAVLGVVMSLVFLGLLHGQIQPEAFSFFDFGPAWWRGERP